MKRLIAILLACTLPSTLATAQSWIDAPSDRLPSPAVRPSETARSLDDYPAVAAKLPEYAELSQATNQDASKSIPGWKNITSDIVSSSPKMTKAVEEAKSANMVYAVYKNETDSRTVVVFRGSVFGQAGYPDEKTNYQQVMDGPESTRAYNAALSIAVALKASGAINENTVFTGQSKGGGEAQYVTHTMNRIFKKPTELPFRAVTFNAAGVNPLGVRTAIPYSNAMSANIVNVNMSNDYLVSQGPAGNGQLGQQYLIKSSASKRVYAHEIAYVLIDLRLTIQRQTDQARTLAALNQPIELTTNLMHGGINSIGPILFATANSTPATIQRPTRQLPNAVTYSYYGSEFGPSGSLYPGGTFVLNNSLYGRLVCIGESVSPRRARVCRWE